MHMFHLAPWDAFLGAYLVTVFSWLSFRELQARRIERRTNLQGQITKLQSEVASLSGEVQRLSSRPPPQPMSSPVVVIPRSESLPVSPISFRDTLYRPSLTDEEEPTTPLLRAPLIPVEIVDDSEEVAIPETLRSGAGNAAAE